MMELWKSFIRREIPPRFRVFRGFFWEEKAKGYHQRFRELRSRSFVIH